MSIHKSDAIPVMNQFGSDVVSCNNAFMLSYFHLDLDITSYLPVSTFTILENRAL